MPLNHIYKRTPPSLDYGNQYSMDSQNTHQLNRNCLLTSQKASKWELCLTAFDTSGKKVPILKKNQALQPPSRPCQILRVLRQAPRPLSPLSPFNGAPAVMLWNTISELELAKPQSPGFHEGSIFPNLLGRAGQPLCPIPTKWEHTLKGLVECRNKMVNY
jgi:hypothetical protein